MKTNFNAFLAKFQDAVDSGLKSFQEAHLAPVETFKEKYQSVASDCEKWSVTKHSPLFFADYKTTGDDMDQVGAARNNVKSTMKSLAKFCGHVTTSKSLEPTINLAKDSYKNATSLINDASKCASVLLVTAVLIRPGSKAQDVKATVEMSHKAFGVSKDQFSPKLIKLLNDMLKGDGESKELEKSADRSKKRPSVPAFDEALDNSGKSQVKKTKKSAEAEADGPPKTKRGRADHEGDEKNKRKEKKKAKRGNESD